MLGGKNDRTTLAVLEYYPQHKKLFLSQLFEKIKTENDVSADQILIEQIQSFNPGIQWLAIDVPLDLPKCLRCPLKCPGYEKCKEPEIQWMWKQHRDRKESRKNTRLFTPYTQRCAELYFASELEEPFHLPEALGANIAPLTARSLFLQKRLKVPMIEVFPALSFWRLGRALGVPKKLLQTQGRMLRQHEAREQFLNALIEKRVVFVYQQDVQRLAENKDAFNAFLSALTAFLHSRDQCEHRPRGFPEDETWVKFPVENPKWF
ncbi:MAG: DUF429 domain-containing protein [Bdellovibrionia bacterium]